jgi:hypothetical protein
MNDMSWFELPCLKGGLGTWRVEATVRLTFGERASLETRSYSSRRSDENAGRDCWPTEGLCGNEDPLESGRLNYNILPKVPRLTYLQAA